MGNRVAFVLAAVNGGPMIVNRMDFHAVGDVVMGVGADLLELGSHEQGEIDMLSDLAVERHRSAGPGVVVVDGGANIGTFTVQLAQRLSGWGAVFAFEAQERIFLALAGNVALNNLFNCRPLFAALGSKSGSMRIPALNHQMPANFGGLALRPDIKQDPGQKLDFTGAASVMVPLMALDDMHLPRLDILKLDIEGMEPDALQGARETIKKCKPIVFAEISTCGNVALARALPDYDIIPSGMNALCFHKDDPLRAKINMVQTLQ